MKTKQFVLCAFLAGLCVVSKEMLAFLPNVELVTFLMILYSLCLDLKSVILISILFCFVQMMLYGVGLWTPMYFIVWPGLCLMTYCFRKVLKTEQRLSLYSGIFGLCFGFLFSIPFFMISLKMGWAYFINGIVFDVIHGVSNYIIMMFLYEPSFSVFSKLTKNGFRE